MTFTPIGVVFPNGPQEFVRPGDDPVGFETANRELAPGGTVIAGPAACLTQRVLLVEASRECGVLVREMLDEHARFDITTVASVPEALAAIELSTPACILLDVPPRGADRIEAIFGLRRATPATPLVVLVDPDDESRGLEAMRAGAQDYVVTERVAGAELCRVVRHVIERAEVSSMDAIVSTDGGRRISEWNLGAERLLGHMRDQAIGREFGILFPAEDRHRETDFLDRALRGEPTEPHPALMRKLDGALVEVSLSTSPVHHDSGHTVGASVIAQHAAGATAVDAAIHANERRLRQIVETANEGIWTLDEEWNTTFANQKMAEILGTTVEEMFGTPVFAYYDEDKRAEAKELLERRVTGDRDQFEISLRRRDGREAAVLISASGLFDADGRLTGALAMVADITVRRQAEREVAQWQRLEGLGQLAGGVAHDMNNLLGVILNFSEFGLDVVGDGPGGEELTEIRQAAQRAAALTSQLLVFARQEMVSHQALDINALLGDLEKLLRRTIGDHISLVSRHGRELPAVKANPGFLEQVVINLVVNSRDAMPDGGEVTITTALVTLDEDAVHGDLPRGDCVCLAVSDNGEGMSKGVAARAFEPFFTTKAVGTGTGLGLSTVYGAVAKAGGRVELRSEVGEGTEVKVFLPLASADVERVTGSTELQPVPPAQGKVLVVEDDDGLRRVTARILEAGGYDVLVADGPQLGLELAQEQGDDLAVVVTDVVMPDMSGPEMARRIGESLPELPVVFLSGYTDRPHALPEGALFLGKPFARAELLREVAKAAGGSPWPTS